MPFYFQLLLPLFLSLFVCTQAKLTEDELKNFLQNTYEKEASQNCYKANIAEFDYETDINNQTKQDLTVSIVVFMFDHRNLKESPQSIVVDSKRRVHIFSIVISFRLLPCLKLQTGSRMCGLNISKTSNQMTILIPY